MNGLVPENSSDIRPFRAFLGIFKHYFFIGKACRDRSRRYRDSWPESTFETAKIDPLFNEICFRVYQCHLCDIGGGVTVLPVPMQSMMQQPPYNILTITLCPDFVLMNHKHPSLDICIKYFFELTPWE